MKIKLSQSEFCLLRSQTLSLDDGAGVRIEAQAGTVWVTQDHDLRDVVLQKGQTVTLDGNGPAIVQAFEASRIRLSPPAPAMPARVGFDWAARFVGAFRRALPQSALA